MTLPLPYRINSRGRVHTGRLDLTAPLRRALLRAFNAYAHLTRENSGEKEESRVTVARARIYPLTLMQLPGSYTAHPRTMTSELPRCSCHPIPTPPSCLQLTSHGHVAVSHLSATSYTTFQHLHTAPEGCSPSLLCNISLSTLAHFALPFSYRFGPSCCLHFIFSLSLSLSLLSTAGVALRLWLRGGGRLPPSAHCFHCLTWHTFFIPVYGHFLYSALPHHT